MPALNWRNWLPWAILVPCLLGCRSLFKSEGPPRDPLFVSKTPTTAKAEYAPPVALAYLEPTVPCDPYSVKNAPAFADKNGRSIQGTLTNRSMEQE
jgi:hypothetical protein